MNKRVHARYTEAMIGVTNPSLACLPPMIRVVGGHKIGVFCVYKIRFALK